jgi:hypothetical protein
MRNVSLISLVALGLILAPACGGDSGRDGASGGDGNTIDPGDGDGDDDDDDNGTNDGDDDDDNGTATGDGDGDDDDDDNGGDTKYDVLGIPDAAPCTGPGGGDDPEFSYIWIANSSQNTITKLNTVSMIEEGRYYTRADSSGSPSRTTVNLAGDVAVANRNGGVTKFYANHDHCQESNGQGGLQTSSGANDILAWNMEECRAWDVPMNYVSQRPVSWTAGQWDGKTCGYSDEQLWTAGTSNSSATVDVFLINGDDGTIADQVVVNGLASSSYGIYGAAADGDGNMWGSQLGSTGKIIKVDIDDMSYQIWNNPQPWHWYGMTVDSDGYVWVCSSTGAGRFDPDDETWQSASIGGYTGCMADAGDDGLLWMATGQGVQGVNRDTLVVDKSCPSTNGSYGISIDFQGNVWAVSGNGAKRLLRPDRTVHVLRHDRLWPCQRRSAQRLNGIAAAHESLEASASGLFRVGAQHPRWFPESSAKHATRGTGGRQARCYASKGPMMSDSPLTLAVLREIRDEIKSTRTEFTGELRAVGEDLGRRIDGTNERVGLVENTLLELAQQQRFTVRYTRTMAERGSSVEDEVADLKRRVGVLEAHGDETD